MGQLSAKLCSGCGGPLEDEIPGKLCSACALSLALEEVGEADEGDSGKFGDARSIVVSGSTSRSPSFNQSGQWIGSYKLLQQIGEGGCGVVYMAEQEEPVRRRVALKIIKLGMDTKEVIARFEAERQALAMMDHPNIAKVLDAGATQNGRPYFVMELVRGVKITKYCDQRRMSTRERLELFVKVCQAVQHAHQKGIIHRDLKPSNILVTLHNGMPTPKVIDFGIAKATQGRLTDKTLFTAFEQFIGTPAYMSPEQAEISGLDIDTRTDIYSLGVLLYEILTGTHPFDPGDFARERLDEIRRRIREEEPMHPSTRFRTMEIDEQTDIARRRGMDLNGLRQQLKGDLDWIVMKCLEKVPSRRYETANGLAADVQRFLNVEAIVARPPSKRYHLQKWVRRNKAMVGVTLGIIAALLLGLGLATVGFVHERQARMAATIAQNLAADAQAAQAIEAARANQLAEDWRHQVYAADILVAQEAIKQRNLGQAQSLLKGLRPKPGDSDLRGWEWRYLWNQCQSDALYSLPQQSNSVYSMSVSPDGRFLALGKLTPRKDQSPAVSIVDLATKQSRGLISDQSQDTAVQFSHSGNLLAASVSTRVHLWQTSSFYTKVATLEAGGTINALSFSLPDQYLAGYDMNSGAIVLWDLTSSNQMIKIPSGPRTGIIHLCDLEFGPQGRYLAVGNADGQIQLRGVPSWNVLHTFQGRPEGVTALAFSPDGRYLAASFGFPVHEIKVWNMHDMMPVAELFGHRKWVLDLAFSPDSQCLASVSADQTVRLWRTGSFDAQAELQGHNSGVWSVDFAPDNKTLYSGSKNGKLLAWNTHHQDTKNVPHLIPHCFQAGFSPVSNVVAGILRDGTAFIWDPAIEPPMRIISELGSNNTSFAFLTNGDLVVGDHDGTLRQWDHRGREVRVQSRVPGIPIYPIEVLPQTKRLLTEFGRGERHISALWDLDIWTVCASVTNVQSIGFTAISPDERSLAFGNSDGSIAVHRLPDLRLQTSWIAHRWYLGGLAFTADGMQLVSSSADGTAKLWDIQTHRELAVIYDEIDPVFGLRMSRDGSRLLIGSSVQSAVMLYDMKTLRHLIDLEGKGGIFANLRFSYDESMIMGKNINGTLHLWSAPSREDIP